MFYLRTNAKLILNLLYLTVDNSLIINPNKQKVRFKALNGKELGVEALELVAERLILNEDNPNDVKMVYENLLNKSLESWKGAMSDFVHYHYNRIKN